MSTISAGTSNTTSLVYTGDTTGNLAFQINGTTEAMRITSGQRVGIGSTAPQSPLEVYGLIRTTGFVANPTSGAGMEMAWDGTQGIVQAFSDRTAATTAPVYFTGGQIKFPATQNASTDPNTLDDYEEGTWTPTIIGSSTPGTVSYIIRNGYYTKIGNRVFVQCYLFWNSGTGSGSLVLSGLPFTSSSLSNSQGGLAVTYITNTSLSPYNFPTPLLQPNRSSIDMYQSPSGGGGASAMSYGNGEFVLSGQYFV